jgi:hypothetical protein
VSAQPFYPFQTSDAERQQLIDQNKLVATLTQGLFRARGT